ncbi:MAG: prepilin-type N-terminal cleavage/methylation domain-containing protein [Pyrinomonadaceae bacterium]
MNKKKLTLQSGLSIIELLIVLVITAIIVTIAVTQFKSAKTDFDRQNITREFKINLERARFDSVKRHPSSPNDMSRVVLASPTSFTVILDQNRNGTVLNPNGTVEASDSRQFDFTNRSDAQIVVSNTLNYPVTIRFDHRGQIIAQDAGGVDINAVFTICSRGHCSGTNLNVNDLTVISVSPTGTISILPQGQTPGALPTPAISGTPPRINCQLMVANANVMCS